MNKIVCFPKRNKPNSWEDDTRYFELYSHSEMGSPEIGYIASGLPQELRRLQLLPSIKALDFLSIALGVVAADKAVLRNSSPDGWTRELSLTVYLREPELWSGVKAEFEEMLRFVSGDFWHLDFLPTCGAAFSVTKKPAKRKQDCVCLLSGGVDSLVGAIDLTQDGRQPLFVSQIFRGDKENQKNFAALLGEDNHVQLSCSIQHEGNSEESTRARSIVFFAYALLAACAISPNDDGRKRVCIPENGFISLNVPLDKNRLGSLSTKTTHPVYMRKLQEICDKVGMNIDFVLPYRYMTKGEVLKACKNQETLMKTVFSSVSCGKYRVHNLQHCGSCIPCLVRRAAFYAAGIEDKTDKGYVNEKIRHIDSKDVSAAAMSVLSVEKYGIERFIGSNLSFAEDENETLFRDMILRGINELGSFLRHKGVL